MPIKIQYGGQGGTTAGQILAQAGLAGLQREQQERQFTQQMGQQTAERAQRDRQLTQKLAAQSSAQMRQIDAAADRQKQAADDAMARTAMQFGLEGQVREQEFNRAMKAKQEEGRAQAEQWEYKYTTEQRRKIAKFNEARQQVDASQNLTPEQKTTMHQAIDMQQAGFASPAMVPADLKEKKYPPEQGLGDIWKGPDGILMGRGMDGKPFKVQTWKDGKEFHETQLKMEQEKAAFTIQIERDRWERDTRLELMKEGKKVVDKDLIETTVPYGPGEIDELLREASITTRERQEMKQVAIQAAADLPWWQRPENRDLPVTEEDTKYPEQIGYAMAYRRKLDKMPGGYSQLPENLKLAYNDAGKIIREYEFLRKRRIAQSGVEDAQNRVRAEGL